MRSSNITTLVQLRLREFLSQTKTRLSHFFYRLFILQGIRVLSKLRSQWSHCQQKFAHCIASFSFKFGIFKAVNYDAMPKLHFLRKTPFEGPFLALGQKFFKLILNCEGGTHDE